MASPHVAGLAAYLAGLGGDYNCSHIQKLAVKDRLSGLPPGTVNLLANNGASVE